MSQVAEAHIWAKGGHCFEIGVSEEIGSRETGLVWWQFRRLVFVVGVDMLVA